MSLNSTLDCSDPHIVSELYKKFLPLAVSKTEYLTGQVSVAQEIVQDVFEKLWLKQLVFPSLAAAYSWVYTACHNAAIDHLRSRRRATAHHRDVLAQEPQLASSPAERTANRALLIEVIGHLSVRESQILAFQIVDGLSHKEIAQLLTVSEKTVQRDCLAIQRKVATLRRVEHA